MSNRNERRLLAGVAVLLLGIVAGCPVDFGDVLDDLEDLELTIDQSVNIIQEEDPREVVVLPADFDDRGDTIIIADDADVIVDVSEDLVIVELPDITLVGFENLTGFDVYITYAVDGELQGVLVYRNETLLLEYPCLTLIELIAEEDFDPLTGSFLDEYDLTGIDFVNPFDFECGDALIITIDPFALTASTERIDLID
jgi:hypothetical protein